MLESLVNALVALWDHPGVQAVAGILGLILAIATVIGVSWQLLKRSTKAPPSDGQPIPTAASELEQAQLIQRNRFILQSICLDYYATPFGRQLISPLKPMEGLREADPIPLLVDPNWLPAVPIPFKQIKLHWSPDTPPSTHLDSALDHRLEFELKKRKSQNRPVYRLNSASAGAGGLELTFSHDTYVSYVNTCEAMLWSTAVATVRFLISRGYTKFVPDREYEILRASANTIMTNDPYRTKVVPNLFTNRCASVGVNALTIIRRQGSFPIFLMHRRGEVNREASSTYHVIPAGTFQPILWNDREHATEFDIDFTLLREFAEECYNDKADEEGHLDDSIAEIRKKNRRLDATLQLHAQGAIKTFFMGLSIDPVTLKPEVLALCLADLTTLKASIGEFQEQYEGVRVQEPFDRQRIADLLERAQQERLLSAAMGCLALAHKHFDFITSELEGLPQ